MARAQNNLNAGDVWKYDTAKNTWTAITPPLDPFQSTPRGGFRGLSVYSSEGQPDMVAAATLDRWYPVDSVYVSKDSGNSWVSQLGPLSSIPNTYGNWAFPSSVITLSPWLTFGPSNAKFGWWQAALLIDPHDPNHLMYGTGATIYGTENLLEAFNNASPNWAVQAPGIEETAMLTLISPTQGAHLLSGMGRYRRLPPRRLQHLAAAGDVYESGADQRRWQRLGRFESKHRGACRNERRNAVRTGRLFGRSRRHLDAFPELSGWTNSEHVDGGVRCCLGGRNAFRLVSCQRTWAPVVLFGGLREHLDRADRTSERPGRDLR